MNRFNLLVQQFQSRNLVEEAYQIASQRYYLNPYQISEIQPQQARQIYQGILQKFYKGSNHQNSRNWYQNELRLFIWTLVCYLYLKGSGLEQMCQKDWQLFSQIFPKKDPQLFQYQSQALIKNKIKVKDRVWVKQQSQILTQIMKKQTQKIKWNQVSKDLYFLSQKTYFRTAKQCRERWLNHLDPSKKKGKWTAEECSIMFEHVKKQGKKWAQLVKKLDKSRNQHTIKNKFNSLLKKQKKQNQKCSEEQIYDIILARINNAIRNNNSHTASQITFDIDDIPSSSHNFPINLQKTQKKQNQSQTSQHSFSFDNILRKIKYFKNPKQKHVSSTSLIPTKSEIKQQNIKQQNESDELKNPAFLGNLQEQPNQFQKKIRNDSQQFLQEEEQID